MSSELWHLNNNGLVSYKVWQRLSNNMSVYFAYYAGIMLDTFGYLLCWHNWPGWAAPVVPGLKQNGAIRPCGDYHITVNQASKVDTYPLPKVDCSKVRWQSFYMS